MLATCSTSLSRTARGLETLYIEGVDFTEQGLATIGQSRLLREVTICTCDRQLSFDASHCLRQASNLRTAKIVQWTEEDGERVLAEW